MNTGIPTIYNDCQYRSRLEAKWAAFFDLLGWQYQYEPYDLNGWIPDFSLFGQQEILVEIKPYSTLKEFDRSKILMALLSTEKWGKEILLLGCRIFPSILSSSIGWLGEFIKLYSNPENEDCAVSEEYGFDRAVIGMVRDKMDFHSDNGGYQGRITGQYNGCQLFCNPDHIEKLWREAGNRVQWKAQP